MINLRRVAAIIAPAALCGALVGACFSAVAQDAPAPVPVSAEAPAVWTPRNGDRLEFDVFRNGEPFGRHTVVFTRQDDRLTVETDIELKVKFGPITAFHYVHDATESWLGGSLQAVRARTKNEGKWSDLAVQAVEGGFNVVGAAYRGIIQGPTIPSTHWNFVQMRQRKMLSTETGEMLPMTVVDQGIERIRVGAGEVLARRFLVRSQMEATFWYDASGRWVKCAFETKGQKVEYRLRALPG